MKIQKHYTEYKKRKLIIFLRSSGKRMDSKLLRLQDSLASLLKDRDNSHGYHHARRVVDLIKIFSHPSNGYSFLSEKDRYNSLVIAYLHDLNDPKYASEELELLQKKLLAEYLLDLSPEAAVKIIKGASWTQEQKRISEKKKDDLSDSKILISLRNLLSDADKIDALGIIGYERCLTYSRVKHRGKAESEIAKNMIIHAYEKIFLLKNYFHSPIAREMAERETNIFREKIHELEDKYYFTVAAGLHRFAGGLNIEGGRPGNLLKSGQKWVYLIEVLDDPLQDKNPRTFEELEKKQKENKYQILEDTIEELNMHRTLSAYLMVLLYYYHTYPDKKIALHCHQFPQNAEFFTNFFKKALFPKNDISGNRITYLTDTPTFVQTKVDYSPYDIIISLSQCAGIGFSSGTLFMADSFRSFANGKLGSKQDIQNHLLQDLPEIIISKWNAFAADWVNKNYSSIPIQKKHYQASSLQEKDFIKTCLLQADDIWNPSRLDPISLV